MLRQAEKDDTQQWAQLQLPTRIKLLWGRNLTFPLCLLAAKRCIDVQEVNATHSLVRRVLTVVFQPFRPLKQGQKVHRHIAAVQLDVQVGV